MSESEVNPPQEMPPRAGVPVTQREAEAAALRKSGLFLREIAEKMGTAHQNIWWFLNCYYDKTGDMSVKKRAPRKDAAARLETRKTRHKRNVATYNERYPDKSRIRMRNWRHANGDREREKAQIYKKSNPDMIKSQMDRWRSNPRNRMKSIVSSRIADAKRRSIPVDEQAMREFIANPPLVCAISGQSLDYSVVRGRRIGMSPSIDRIRPELGYIRGNMAVVGHRFNTIKSFGTASDHRLVAVYLENHDANG